VAPWARGRPGKGTVPVGVTFKIRNCAGAVRLTGALAAAGPLMLTLSVISGSAVVRLMTEPAGRSKTMPSPPGCAFAVWIASRREQPGSPFWHAPKTTASLVVLTKYRFANATWPCVSTAIAAQNVNAPAHSKAAPTKERNRGKFFVVFI